MFRRTSNLLFLGLFPVVVACKSVASDPGGSTQVLPLRYAVAGELVGELRTLFADRDGLRVVADDRTNSVLFAGSNEDVKDALDLAASLDKEVGSVTSGAAAAR